MTSTMTAPPPPQPQPAVSAPPALRMLPDSATSQATVSWPGHLARYGPLPALHADRILAEVEAAGIRGRGGAGFPTARKLAAVRAGRRPLVVGNGAEGEPASSKDATLLTAVPHLVLDGLQVAAAATGAREAVLYVHEGPLVARLEAAVAARHGTDAVAVRVVDAPATFVSGQESAVVQRLEGRPAIPRSTPPLVVHRGVSRRPTLVQNVETLALLALVVHLGADAFRGIGDPDEPGTVLHTVGGAVHDPGVVEVPTGTTVRDVLNAAGGLDGPLSGVLLGGFHGSWLPPDALDLPLSRSALAAAGASRGAGVVLALPAIACPLVETARIVDYLAGQSARQCGPCLSGLPALAGVLGALAHAPARGGRPGDATAQARRLADLVTGRGACHHPDGTARLVRSTLDVFPDEVTAHAQGRCLLTVTTTNSTRGQR